MRRARALLVSALLASVMLAVSSTSLPAQAGTRVHVARPRCEALPFTHEQLLALLAVELRAQRAVLAGAGAETLVTYDATVCGATSLVLTVQRGDQPARTVELAGVGARALALLIAELLREPTGAPEAPRADEPSPPAAEATVIARSLGSALGSPQAQRVRARRAQARPAREASASPAPPGRSLEDVSLVAGLLLVQFLYNPQNQSWIFGLDAEVMVRMPFWRSLAVHAEAGTGQGGSEWGIHLATFDAAVWVGITLGGPDLALELGPRLGFLVLGAVSVPNDGIALETSAMLAFGGIARVSGRLDGAASLIVDLEVSTNVTDAIAFSVRDPFFRLGGGIDDPYFTIRAGVMLD